MMDVEFLDEEIGAGWIETNPGFMTNHDLKLHVRQLIAEEVQAFPILYDVSNPRHMDRLAKNNAWAHISDKLNLEISELKNKWKMMKAVYMKHKRGQRSGLGAVQEKVPRYVQTMRYLDAATSPTRPMSYPQKPTDPLQTLPVSPVLHSSPMSSPSASISLPSTPVPIPCPQVRQARTSSPQLSQSSSCSPPTFPNFPLPPNDRQSPVPDQPFGTSHLTSYRKQKYTPSEMFLLSFADQMERMPTAVQNRVRTQICQIFLSPDTL